MTKKALALTFALIGFAQGCTFKAPNANKPLGCACDPRPNAYAYCKYDGCNYAGCRAGFFDLDLQPSNGCEADRSQLPGNLVFTIAPGGYGASWDSEFENHEFTGGGIATATVADPTCKPTATQRCDVRLEAFQMSLIARGDIPQDKEKFEDAIVATTAPLTGSVTGNGVTFSDPPTFVSFGLNGDRAVLEADKGSIYMQMRPSTDGTVRLSISGSASGYVDNRKGVMTYFAAGKTPQLFDASAPDARAHDASNDGDAEMDDATVDASDDRDDQ